jgi:hypothetical protein
MALAIECWVFGVGCWVFGVGCLGAWVLVLGCSSTACHLPCAPAGIAFACCTHSHFMHMLQCCLSHSSSMRSHHATASCYQMLPQASVAQARRNQPAQFRRRHDSFGHAAVPGVAGREAGASECEGEALARYSPVPPSHRLQMPRFPTAPTATPHDTRRGHSMEQCVSG